ncbi:DUF4192 domain-containing protein [Streptomyces sp. YKOK-I1]
MTNHSETTGSFENGDISGRDGLDGLVSHDGRTTHGATSSPGDAPGRGDTAAYGGASADGGEQPYDDGEPPYNGPLAYISHTPYDASAPYTGESAAHHVTLRTPGELADALPYLLGYRPEDSIVLVALGDRAGRGRFGGRARLGIPAHPGDWPAAARQLAEGLVKGGERRGARPAQMVAYLCQDPAKGETGREVMKRLDPLADALRVACGKLDAPVIEALCISDGRFWSYCCPHEGCCPVEGTSMGLPGTSVLAAAATYAGIQVRGTLRELRARLQPLETGVALEQEVALDTANIALVTRMLDDTNRAVVAGETIERAGQLIRRFAAAPVVLGNAEADRRDDELLGCDEAAALILGLQDRVTRDRAAEWMEGDEAPPALRLWRALARRCVGPFGEHAAAPLTLAGWVAWSGGDELEAREALAMALGADPDYLFARLLHQACNEGLDPESVRRCLRSEREGRQTRASRAREADGPAAAGGEKGVAETARTRRGPGANAGRPRTPSARPAPAGRGGSRPRATGKPSARRRGACPEGARADGDDTRGEG